MVLTQAVDTIAEIHPAKQRDLGIVDRSTYRMFWHRFTLLASTLETTGLSVPGEDRRMDVHEFVSRVIDASIPPTYAVRPFVALDDTAFETWARRRPWGKTPALDPGRQLPDDIETVPNGAVSESGWPRTAPDGKPLHTKDPDAREGHRSGKNGKPGNIYTGYEAHIVLGMHLVPASSHRGIAAVKLVDSVLARGREIREIAADRGYTPANRRASSGRCGNATSTSSATCTPISAEPPPGRNPARSGSTAASTPQPSPPDSATSLASNATCPPKKRNSARDTTSASRTRSRRTAPATRTATSGSKVPPSQAKSAARTFHGPCCCHTPGRPLHAHRTNPAAAAWRLRPDRHSRTHRPSPRTPTRRLEQHRLGTGLPPPQRHRIHQRRTQNPPHAPRTRVHPSLRHRQEQSPLGVRDARLQPRQTPPLARPALPARPVGPIPRRTRHHPHTPKKRHRSAPDAVQTSSAIHQADLLSHSREPESHRSIRR